MAEKRARMPRQPYPITSALGHLYHDDATDTMWGISQDNRIGRMDRIKGFDAARFS
jgi:hypothetical protein